VTESVVNVEWRSDFTREYLLVQRYYMQHNCPISDQQLIENGFDMSRGERKCLDNLEAELNRAQAEKSPYPCVILECVQSCGRGALGVLFVRELAKVCSRTRTPVVSDCIMTAVRTGCTILDFEYLGFAPDMCVVGKAIPGSIVLLVHHPTSKSNSSAYFSGFRPRLLMPSKPIPKPPNTTIKLPLHQYLAIMWRMHEYLHSGFLSHVVDMGVLVRDAMVGNCLDCMSDSTRCARGVGLLIAANHLMIQNSVYFTDDRLLPKLDITATSINENVCPTHTCSHVAAKRMLSATSVVTTL